MASEKYDLSVIFKVLDKASAPLANIAGKFQRLTPTLSVMNQQVVKLGQSVKKFGEGMGRIGRSLSLKVTLPVVAFGALSLKASMDFNKGMANVASLIPGNIKRVEDLKKAVQEMALRTGKSTDLMAEGLYQVISAFGDSSETAGILEINARAAAAGLATVKDAVDLTSAVMKGYGDISEGAAKKAADLAFQTVKLGQTTFPELAASIGSVTPLAAQLNVKQEELFNGFATLTGVTGGAAEVSTQLAGALRALVKPTDVMKKALNYLKRTGVISKATGKELLAKKGLVGAFQTLNDLAKGNEEILTQMFGRMEPLVAIFALLGPQADTYKTKLEQMWNAAGSMNEAFDEQTKGINKAGFAWDVFKIKVTLLREEFGDLLGKAFRPVIIALGDLVTWLSNLSDEAKTTIAVIAGVLALFGPLLMILSPIISAFGSLVIAMAVLSSIGIVGLGGLITFLAPILLLVAAITVAVIAVSLAVIRLVKNWGFLKSEFLKNPFTFILDMLDSLPFVIPLFDSLVLLWEKLGSLGEKIKNWIFDFDRLARIGRNIITAWSRVKAFFIDLFTSIVGKIKEIFWAIVDEIKKTFNSIIETIKVVFEKIEGIYDAIFDSIKSKIKDLIDYLPDFIKKRIGVEVDVKPSGETIPSGVKFIPGIKFKLKPSSLIDLYGRKMMEMTNIFKLNFPSALTSDEAESIKKVRELRPETEHETMGGPMPTSSLLTPDEATIMRMVGGLRSETDINIKVTSDPGTTATVQKVEKKRGDANVRTTTLGYVGAY